MATFRGELGADAFPPASAFRRRMFVLSRSSCSSRSPFFENRARPLHAFLLLSPFRGPRSRPQTPTAIGAYGNWPAHAHVGVWLRWVVFFWCGRGGKQGPRGMPRGCFQDARPPPLPLRRLQSRGELGAGACPPVSALWRRLRGGGRRPGILEAPARHAARALFSSLATPKNTTHRSHTPTWAFSGQFP